MSISDQNSSFFPRPTPPVRAAASHLVLSRSQGRAPGKTDPEPFRQPD